MRLSTVKFVFIVGKRVIKVIKVENVDYFAPDSGRFKVGEIDPMYAHIYKEIE
jgi:hypothetical protein